jgi:AcrR family transcriptional regulator
MREEAPMRADARANREALLASAWALIAAEGADVPLTSVAEAAGVGIATLYRHFPTRHDLHVAVLTEARDRVLAVIDEHGPSRWQDPETDWPRLVRALAALRIGPLVTELARAASLDPLGPDVSPIREQLLAALDAVLHTAKDAHLVRTDIDAAHFQLGIAAITRPLPVVGLPGLEDHLEWLTDVYVRGLRPGS